MDKPAKENNLPTRQNFLNLVALSVNAIRRA
jgi:hypothetical protein